MVGTGRLPSDRHCDPESSECRGARHRACLGARGRYAATTRGEPGLAMRRQWSKNFLGFTVRRGRFRASIERSQPNGRGARRARSSLSGVLSYHSRTDMASVRPSA